jgi:signal transduction histidine kinase
MEGWGWQSVHDPEMLPQVLERWKASIATGEPLDMEFPLRGADGRFRWFLTRVMPIKDAAGKVVRWFGTNTDVSAAWEAREVLARNKQELERLVQERTAKLRETIEELEGFSYSIVHDMRGPLRAMQSFAQLAQESCAGCERPESMDFFRRIRIASERMDTLITDALNYSKIVRQDLPLVPVDVGKLVRGMVETYPNLHPPLAEIEVQFDGVVVLGNESALTQVFSNLLGNAVKFVAIGVKPRVTVWAEEMRCTPDTIRSGGGGERRTESGTEYLRRLTRPNAPPGVGYPSHGLVRIWVGDNGIGIPPESQEKVFGMFQRMHGQQDYPGTGIGLTIVRKAMDRMGGRVGVESEPGKGSRFWIELDRTEYSGQRETPARLKEG